MTTRTPMPSPRFTNREGLFLSERVCMAMDAAPRRLAKDGASRGQLDQLLAPLQGKVRAETLMAVESDLADFYANNADPADDPDEGLAADARLRQVVANAKSKEMARRSRETARLFPGLARIKQA
jgi:hypothetical protein